MLGWRDVPVDPSAIGWLARERGIPFREGPEVDALLSSFLQWQLDVNRDSIDLFYELVVACEQLAPDSAELASIVAGLVLGWLALKSRSIWPGVLIHCTVAFCMDWFALIHSGWMAVLP